MVNSHSPLGTSTAPCSSVVGTGGYLPPRRVTNAELAAELAGRGIQTSDEWIVSRTGIQARHFAAPGVGASDLALPAARHALAAAGLEAADLDLIICATSTPDMVFPSTACLLQQKLGTQGQPAFDVQAVCSGFVYALTVADAMIRSGMAQCALVVGTEVFSRLLDFNDRSTCVLFGDGAGAVVLKASQRPGVVVSRLHANGHQAQILWAPGAVQGGHVLGDPTVKMDGPGVYRLAVAALEQVAGEVLQAAGRQGGDVDWFVPHQANLRIMQSTARKLGIAQEKVIVTLDQQGNTSAASVPLALDHGVRAGLIRAGHSVLLEGVGGGFTWGAVLVDF